MRHNDHRHIYTIDISEEMNLFRHYHKHYEMPGIPQQDMTMYIASLIEQMLAHFDIQNTAVQSFIGHYVVLITEAVSIRYRYHPLHFIRLMENEEYQLYAQCLVGFAESIYRKLVEHGMFTYHGQLKAAFELINEYDVLHLIIRPEVPDVFHL
jgi:hypothetical protein